MAGGAKIPGAGKTWRVFTLFSVVVLFLYAGVTWAAEPEQPLSSMDPKKAGELLAQRLRASAPTEPTALKGRLKIRRRGAPTIEIPFRFHALPGDATWKAMYATERAGPILNETLTIVHSADKPNEYFYDRGGAHVRLTNDQAAVALASSDFWLTDLGLEFAHWPEQRYLKGEMREGRYCYVLESLNPNRTGKGYGRVVSWVDQESGGIILAEGYDAAGKLLKEFSVRSVKKVQGQWQLQEMEIRNAQTRSRTRLLFDYEQK